MSKIFKSLVAPILIICLVHTRKQRGSGDCGDEPRRLTSDKGPQMCDSQGREHWRQIKHWISSSPSSFGVLAAFSVITLLSKLEKEPDVEHSVNYTFVDPMRKVFDRLGVQVGKGLGQGVKMSFDQENTQMR